MLQLLEVLSYMQIRVALLSIIVSLSDLPHLLVVVRDIYVAEASTDPEPPKAIEVKSKDGTEEAEQPEGDEQSVENEDHGDDNGEESVVLLHLLLKEEKTSEQSDDLERLRQRRCYCAVLRVVLNLVETWVDVGKVAMEEVRLHIDNQDAQETLQG